MAALNLSKVLTDATKKQDEARRKYGDVLSRHDEPQKGDEELLVELMRAAGISQEQLIADIEAVSQIKVCMALIEDAKGKRQLKRKANEMVDDAVKYQEDATLEIEKRFNDAQAVRGRMLGAISEGKRAEQVLTNLQKARPYLFDPVDDEPGPDD